MQPPRYYVWEWLDEAGNIRYLGNAPRDASDELPWTVLWNLRHTSGSDLNRWLRMLDKQPSRGSFLPSQPLTRREANAMASQRRKQLRKMNVALLSARPDGTSDGGGCRKACVSPVGDVYISVREAARDLDVPSAKITRLCQDPESNWRYLENQQALDDFFS